MALPDTSSALHRAIGRVRKRRRAEQPIGDINGRGEGQIQGFDLKWQAQKYKLRLLGVRLFSRKPRLHATAKRKLSDSALDVKFNPCHLREQIDIGGPDRTSAEIHFSRH